MSLAAHLILGWLFIAWAAAFVGIVSAILELSISPYIGAFLIAYVFGSILLLIVWVWYQTWKAGSAPS